MIAAEFAVGALHRSFVRIALHQHLARDDHRLAEPGDPQLDKAGGQIDLAALQRLFDDLSYPVRREPLRARYVALRAP
jgi:hypothetical protein